VKDDFTNAGKYICNMDLKFSLAGISTAAKEFIKILDKNKVVALHGEMGAGKTTFVHAVCEAMNVTDAIGSPTFSIINQYQTTDGNTIYHIDMYRLKDEEEAIQAGVEDCLYSGNYCFVEWPDKAPGIFPADTLHIHIAAVENETRKLTINL
jgi:tRNA threonylcarbamoyladenosine biosynthesis protein TsaE